MRAALLLFYLLNCQLLIGQLDSIVRLSPVEVTDTKIERLAVGASLQTFNRPLLQQYHQQNLSELLADRSGIFIRTYGAGSLASSSARGAGFGHTAVIWNGFNLQNSMNGGNDLLLFPSLLFDKIQLQYGGSSSLNGNGAIGASIQLYQQIPFDKGWQGKLAASAGSFHTLSQSAQLTWSNNKQGLRLAGYHYTSDNDFEFEGRNGTEKLVHAATRRWGAMLNHQWVINPKQLLKFFSWHQYNHRQIPPSLTAAPDDATQRDESLRIAAEWSQTADRFSIKSRAAYLLEDILFESTLVGRSPSRVVIIDWQAEGELRIKQLQRLHAGMQFIHEQAEASAAFADQKSRNRLAVFGSWIYSLKKNWKVGINLRQELVDKEWVSPTASLGLEGPLAKDIGWRIQCSRNYHLPSFNDLYWEGAGGKGNPELVAERSWSIESGLKISKTISNLKFEQQAVFFSNWVKDWILWSPVNPSFWMPDNILSVWSRGAEYRMDFSFKFVDWQFATELQYTFTKATNQSGVPTSKGFQLPQTPRHLAHLAVGGQYRNWRLRYLHRLIGRQYTDRLNTDRLAAYQLGEWRLGYSRGRLDLSFVVANSWDSSYRAVPFRPMPGRHFRLEVGYGF